MFNKCLITCLKEVKYFIEITDFKSTLMKKTFEVEWNGRKSGGVFRI